MYNNGFLGSAQRIFNPNSYNYVVVENLGLSRDVWKSVSNFINLYKIHGSINWLKDDDSGSDTPHILEKDIELIRSRKKYDSIMIYPTPQKDRTTLMVPYSDLFRMMQNNLLKKNSILISLGYSFGDEHINRIILTALSVYDFRLVIFGNSEMIRKLQEIGDNRIWIINSEDNIHYFNNFVEKVLPTQDEGSINSSRIYEYTSTLITRLKHLSESEQGDFFDKTSFSNIDEYIKDIIGEAQLLNIDISNLDDTATEVVTKVFSKMLFDYLRALSPRNSMPINLILEEAHRFVRSDMDYGVLGYNIFERIAKEGRKFGLLMGISSQRPSELSKTVVSQCNNFVIHKIQNPDDIQYISRMVPYMNQGMVDRITYLRRGYALVFGTAINLPTLTAFEKATPSPNSGNSNIVEKWYVE